MSRMVTGHKPEPWPWVNNNTQLEIICLRIKTSSHCSCLCQDTTQVWSRFSSISHKENWAKRSSSTNTPSNLLSYSAIPLSELIKNTLKSGLSQTLREVQIEDSGKEDGGLKGFSRWHSLWNWNEQSGKEQRKVKQRASTAAAVRE